jgi:hypothetical protein
VPPAGLALWGRVFDQALRAVPGARVEVVDGSGMSASTVADGSGAYQVTGIPAGTVSVQASKDGYLTSTVTIPVPRNAPTDLKLTFTGTSVDLTGNYEVTFTADAACTQLPDETRIRNYEASMTRSPLPDHYLAGLSSGTFVSDPTSGTWTFGYAGFTGSVAGGFASFRTDAVGSEIIERLTPSTAVLEIEFTTTTRAPVDVSRIAAPLSSVSVPVFGTLSYCAEPNPADPTRCRVAAVTCSSSNHIFTLTRR